MAISGTVTATFAGTRRVYFDARQIFAPSGFTGQIFSTPWSVVHGDQLFGYDPTLDPSGQPLAGAGVLMTNIGKGIYSEAPWQFGTLNNVPGSGTNGGTLISGALYGAWFNGADYGAWRAANGAAVIGATQGGVVSAFSAPTLAVVTGSVGAVVQLYTDGSALFRDDAGQVLLPSFWDIAEPPSYGGVVYNGDALLMSDDGGGSQRVQVVVRNGVEQYRRYMMLDDPTYNDIINDPLYSPECIFSFSNGYMVARSPYIPRQLILINADCSQWWLYDCLPVNAETAQIFDACVRSWGQYFAPNAIVSPLGYMTLSGFSIGANADIYSSFTLFEVNPNSLLNPPPRLPLAQCWNCLHTAMGTR